MIDKKIDSTSVDLPLTGESVDIIDKRIDQQNPVAADLKNTILKVESLKMYFPVTKGLMKRKIADVKAVDDVSFRILKRQTLGIVGESGSGKTTIGNCIMGNCKITGGQVLFNGIDLSKQSPAQMRTIHKDLQMITQDPFASLDPRMKISEAILEGPQVQKTAGTKKEQQDLVGQMLELVGLNPKFADRYPHEFSGGQRQRISIARALALNPSFIVCDEIVSALDVSIQAQIVNLMIRIQQELGITYIFIGHDLSVVRHISNDIAVMYLGKLMELTSSEELYDQPLHPYTQALISAAPIPHPTTDRTRQRILLEGDVPSPMNPPKGCNFCTRCIYADQRCREEEPELEDVRNHHYVACHKVGKV